MVEPPKRSRHSLPIDLRTRDVFPVPVVPEMPTRTLPRPGRLLAVSRPINQNRQALMKAALFETGAQPIVDVADGHNSIQPPKAE